MRGCVCIRRNECQLRTTSGNVWCGAEVLPMSASAVPSAAAAAAAPGRRGRDFSTCAITDFTVLSKIDCGSNGAVFLVSDNNTARSPPEARYALKAILNFAGLVTALQRSHFEEEFRMNKALYEGGVPGVTACLAVFNGVVPVEMVELLDPELKHHVLFDEYGQKRPRVSTQYGLFEYYPHTLKEYLSLQSTVLPFHEFMWIAQQLFTTFCALADKGVLHRDVKPDNIFHDGHDRVFVGDFGEALWLPAVRLVNALLPDTRTHCVYSCVKCVPGNVRCCVRASTCCPGHKPSRSVHPSGPGTAWECRIPVSRGCSGRGKLP